MIGEKKTLKRKGKKLQLMFERTMGHEVVGVKRKKNHKSQHARFNHFHTNFLLNISFPSPKR